MTHAAIHIPHIDYKALSPLFATAGGSMVAIWRASWGRCADRTGGTPRSHQGPT